MDPEQLQSIKNFRSSLGKQGALYHSFNDLKNFEQLIRLHLNRYIQEWEKQSQSTSQPQNNENNLDTSNNDSISLIDDDDDLGLFDYEDIFKDRLAEATKFLVDFGESTKHLGDKMTARTNEIDLLPRDSQGNASRKDAKRIINRTAADMHQYAEQLNVNTPLFSNSFNQGLDAFLQYINLSAGINSDEDYNSLIESISGVLNTFETSSQQLVGFRKSIYDLPRMAKELNKAKRATTGALDNLISDMEASQAVLLEAKTTATRLSSAQG